MNQMIISALLSNHATLGVHWIYDHEFLASLAKKQSLLFMKQDKDVFEQAKTAFFVYPNNTYSVQGYILSWLYDALENNPSFGTDDFSDMLYEHFRPGGDYAGYVEKYSKQQVFNHMIDDLRLDIEKLEVNDQQMVGFVPYIVFKALGRSSEDAFEFAQIYTNEKFYLECFNMLDLLFEKLENKDIKTALSEVIGHAPKEFKEALSKAIEMKETDDFIDRYAGRACPVKHALPVIFHILYHQSSYEAATEMNALIGGASSDRGLLLGAILSKVYDMPQAWKDKI
jgi:hypothetical protein